MHTLAPVAAILSRAPSAAERRGNEALDALLAQERSRAERLLNVLRLGIVSTLALAALAYAPALPVPLRWANGAVVGPMLAWAIFQVLLVRRHRGIYPAWLSAASPVVDATAVTAIILCYGVIGSPAVALKAPIALVYFAILGSRPITGSARSAALVTVAIAIEYAVAVLVLTRVTPAHLWADPISASTSGSVALLDEGMKFVLIVSAGVVATYATAWHERVLRAALAAQIARDEEERDLAARLQEADKLAALGTLAASVAHEVASPLAAIALSAELLGRSLAEPSDREEAAAIAQDAHRTAAAVRNLLAFARHGEAHRAPVALSDVVERALAMLRNLVRDRKVTIEVDADPHAPAIDADAAALERVVINLVINAMQAMEEQPRDAARAPTIRVAVHATADGVSLTVEDTGPGFAPGAAERLFERFFTTKAPGKGTGLGLWMVAETVRNHGGTIAATDTGSGARFTITLPGIRQVAAA